MSLVPPNVHTFVVSGFSQEAQEPRIPLTYEELTQKVYDLTTMVHSLQKDMRRNNNKQNNLFQTTCKRLNMLENDIASLEEKTNGWDSEST